MCLRASLLCLALAVLATPAGAYVEQGEIIPGLLGTTWANQTLTSQLSVSTITDSLASGGSALRMVDSSTSGADAGHPHSVVEAVLTELE